MHKKDNCRYSSVSKTHLRVKSMGTLGRKIVDTNVGDLVKLLNKAFSDEWLAYYRYWIGSKIVRGPNKEAVIAELTLHATEELGHAVLLTTRIIQTWRDTGHKTAGLVQTHELRVRCTG